MSASTSSNSLPLPKPKKVREKKASLKPSSSAPPLGKFLASSKFNLTSIYRLFSFLYGNWSYSIYIFSGEKVVRDKAVATLSRFLAGTKKIPDENEILEVGDLDWSKEFKVDSRLAPLEMAKLWKGIFYCK